MQVDPPVEINRRDGADISHTGKHTLVVTITGDLGQQVTIEVPPNQVVNWIPPAGWRSARFTAYGHAEQFRLIEEEMAA